jgi:hypothetical protein
MLILKSFKIIIAIIAYFNFKIKQFNIINAFTNVIYSLNLLLIICKLPFNFKFFLNILLKLIKLYIAFITPLLYNIINK